MTGVERLKEMAKGQKSTGVQETVNYLISRKDMDSKYLNEEKSLKGMCKFIKSKANNHMEEGWNFISNEVVYAWAIMYFSLPNEFLKIKSENATTINKNDKSKSNNIVSLEDVKQKIEQKKEVEQLNLFGGAI